MLSLESSEIYWCRKVCEDFGRDLTPNLGENWEILFHRLREEIFDNDYSLHAAAEEGCERAIATILESGKDINQVIKGLSFKPIHLSIMKDRKRATLILLARGADPSGRYHSNAIDLAVSHKALSIIPLFPIDELHPETFFNLVQSEDKDMIACLIEKGWDINTKDRHGRNALHYVLLSVRDKSAFQMVKWLVEKGADMQASDFEGITPLHIACEKKDVFVQEYLLDQGASLLALDNNENTPLHWMLWKGNPEKLWKEEKLNYQLKYGPRLFNYALEGLVYAVKFCKTVHSIADFLTRWMPTRQKKEKEA